MKTITIQLTKDELQTLVDALDSHLYWQLAESRERNSGNVFYPESGTDEYRAGSSQDQERWLEMEKVEILEGRLSVMVDRTEE